MLKGKTAVVTGGGRGIGAEVCKTLARNGANIAIVYQGNETAAKAVAYEVSLLGVKANIYKCDVSDFSACKETVDSIINDFSQIDILVNNAGITKDGLVANMKEEQFISVVGVSLDGTFNMIRHVSPHFIKRRTGKIVNIASISGVYGNAGQANYSAAKAGVIGLTKAVAKELGSRSVNVNAVAPGFIETDMTATLSDDIKQAAIKNTPLRRLGTAADVAAAVLFLVSDSAAYITGEVIKVDGGLVL